LNSPLTTASAWKSGAGLVTVAAIPKPPGCATPGVVFPAIFRGKSRAGQGERTASAVRLLARRRNGPLTRSARLLDSRPAACEREDDPEERSMDPERIRFKDHTAEQLAELLAPDGVDARLARRLQSAVLKRGSDVLPET